MNHDIDFEFKLHGQMVKVSLRLNTTVVADIGSKGNVLPNFVNKISGIGRITSIGCLMVKP